MLKCENLVKLDKAINLPNTESMEKNEFFQNKLLILAEITKDFIIICRQ